jgi:hypothetical protein
MPLSRINSASIANSAIITADIADGTITAVKIISVANTQITGLIEAAQIGSANATLVTSGTLPKARLPAGAVLQVVQVTTSNLTTTTTASFADASGLTATITPSSATSKILVLCDISVYIQADNSTHGGVQIVRGSTAVYTDTLAYRFSVNANVALGSHIAFNYLDSPSTTSATTYKIQIQRTTSTGISYGFSVNAGGANISSITLLEIAA